MMTFDSFMNAQVAIAASSAALLMLIICYFLYRSKVLAVLNTQQMQHEQLLLDLHQSSEKEREVILRDFENKLQQQLQDQALLEQRYLQKNTEFEQAEQKWIAIERKLSQTIEENTRVIADNQREIGVLSQKADELTRKQDELSELRDTYKLLNDEYAALKSTTKSQEASFAQERRNFSEKLSLLENAEKQLSTQFENVANKIFEQKSEKFTKSSESGLNQLINPLKEQIENFKRQISDQYIKEGQERASLKTEILGLKELNKQITEEAAALTNALKGDNKQQGNWGELVLERILSESGLRKGHEYETQKSLKDDDGKRFQPDVLVHLPNDKDIVIDSKVSLVAHERFVNSDNEEDRQRAIKEHVASLRGHIKGLSKKDYQDLNGMRTLDYVLMFIPIESAFMSAVEHEPELIKLAMDNQIMLVSPTNLLVALRTINNIWQYEYQNQNANKIADQARKMYDKFHGFIVDMEKIGRNLEMTSKTYEQAMGKLSTGRGNLVRQAEQFKKLGVTPTKSIDSKLVDASQDDDEGENDDTDTMSDKSTSP
ncbi:DNA recombination protein RmuC [Glaciecola sp. MH2013]|uniref:DNA recombination protein RmuC n=1 Tax=Glaciecola sp. MH2013 TaxID=2785524 RepID=UPI001E43E1A6|nr:DNA recombination protein RmuC [Glaciecola sp. MH2013]